METIERSMEVLNDLIQINCERVEVFAHAKKELDKSDNELKVIFELLRDESRENVYELSSAIKRKGIKIIELTATGTLHRAWLDVKSTFAGHGRNTVLDEFKRGEDVIKKVYQKALAPVNGLPPEISEIIMRQQQEIIEANERVQALLANAA